MIETAKKMAKRLRFSSIRDSANLEGLEITFSKVEFIIKNRRIKTTSEEVLFVLNMYRAWNFMLANVECQNSLAVLKEFNKLVGEMMFDGNGSIRSVPIKINDTLWEPPIPKDNEIWSNICNLNAIEDPELKALKYFCYIVRAQMFIDGNERVAQLMVNKILIENGIGIFQINVEDLKDFKPLLISFYESGDDTEIINFMQKNCVKRVAI